METKDGVFIFRPLNRKEYVDIVELYSTEGENAEDEIFKKCVLFPTLDTEDMFAGTIASVSRRIMFVSGFGEAETFLGLLEENRSKMDLADNQMIIVLLKAFPHLTLENINNLDIQQLTYYLALAERVLDIKVEFKEEQKQKPGPIGPINFEAENRDTMRHIGNVDGQGFNPTKRGKLAF